MNRLNLSLEQRKELIKLTRQAPGRVATRAWMVLLFTDGEAKAEIAEIFHCSTRTVKRWLKRYRRKGAKGLFDEPRSGAPRKMDKKLGEAVEEEMAKDPSQDGCQAGFWTVGLLCLRMKVRFGVKLSTNTVRRALHKLGYVCRRPRLYTGGEEKQLPQEARKAISEAKEGKAIALFSDESSFHLLPVLRKMWMKVGKQFRVLTPPRWNQYFTVFGALDAITGRFTWKIFDRKNGENFITFLDELLSIYPEKIIYVILDRASYHRSGAVNKWLESQSRIQLILLPPRNSQLNPAEKIWWWLKGNVAANRTWDKLTALREACNRQLDSLTLEKAMRLASLAAQGVQNF